MKEINQKEDWRQYNTSHEFNKNIKFNKKWYHLIALFDKDHNSEDFDFNEVPEPEEFDFNDNNVDDQISTFRPDQSLNDNKFDFNSILLEKNKLF